MLEDLNALHSLLLLYCFQLLAENYSRKYVLLLAGLKKSYEVDMLEYKFDQFDQIFGKITYYLCTYIGICVTA